MSASLAEHENRILTREEYRNWCDQQPRGRFERVDGQIVAMAPERGGHIRSKSNIFLALRRAIADEGVPCQALPDGATVETGENDYGPDALVNCGPPMGDDDMAAPNPIIVVEVVSPGITSVDTGVKLAGYFQVASIIHYLIVHPIRPMIIHHRRTTEGISTTIVTAGPIQLDPPGLTITTEQIYENQ